MKPRHRLRRLSAKPARSTVSSHRRRRSCGRWRAISGGAGTTIPPACFAIWIPFAGAQLNHNPISLLGEIPLATSRTARRRTALHSRINYAYRRLKEYLERRPQYLGRDARRRSAAAARSPIFRPSSACTNRCRFIPAAWEFWPAITSRARPTWTFRWSASACSTTRAISASSSTANGWQQEEYIETNVESPADGAGDRHRTASRSRCRSIPARGPIFAKVWRMKVGRCDLVAARFQRRRQRAGGSRVDVALVRRRRADAHSPGIAAGRRRLPRAAEPWASRPACFTSTKGTAVSPCWKRFATAWRTKALSFDDGSCRDVAREVVFTTHTPVPAGHDRFSGGLIEEHLGPLRDALGLSHERLMALGRENPGNRARRVLHDGARPEAVAPRQCGVGAARRSFARDVDGAVSRAAPKSSAHRPHHQRRACALWLAPQMFRLYDRHLGAGLARAQRRSRASGKASKTSTTASLWETHLSLKARLLDFVRRRAVEQAERRGESQETLQRLSRVLQPGRADDRLRAPLRHLQARQPDAERHRAAGVDGQRSEAAGAVRLRRQGASARRARQARAAADRADDARHASSATSSSSSKTTTSTSAAISCRASMCG